MLKAIIYDFDGTLTPSSYPEFKILESSGMPGGIGNPVFFKTVHEMAEKNGTSVYEEMIWLILRTMKEAGFRLTDENIALGADQRVFNPGVEEFLSNLRKQGVQNYLLSSGSQAYLKRLTIAPEFEEIYASVLSYDQNDEVNGIARLMTDKEKVVALEEIAEKVNGSKEDFSGIVYVGDGPTDIYAMDHIQERGGNAILIQHDAEDNANGLLAAEVNKVSLTTRPDFTQNSEIVKYIDSLF